MLKEQTFEVNSALACGALSRTNMYLLFATAATNQNEKFPFLVLHHEYAPLHCQVLLADRVVEKFNAVVIHHRLHKE